jgi:hypothetical protein
MTGFVPAPVNAPVLVDVFNRLKKSVLAPAPAPPPPALYSRLRGWSLAIYVVKKKRVFREYNSMSQNSRMYSARIQRFRAASFERPIL